MKRPSISKKMRVQVLQRDGFQCRYCGIKAPDEQLVLDHVVPVAAGGLTDLLNLITACQPCNAGKSDRPLNGAPSIQDTIQTAKKMSAAAKKLLKDQKAAVKSLSVADKAEQELRQNVVNFWCHITGQGAVPKDTINVMLSFVTEHGPELVFTWIKLAHKKIMRDRKDEFEFGHDDRCMGKYVSGCRRKHKETNGQPFKK
jgi:hypothetical protein